MKKAGHTVILFFLAIVCRGQTPIDSLSGLLALSKPDTSRVLLLSELSIRSVQSDHKAAINYAKEGLELARSLHFKKGEADCLRRYGIALFQEGNYPEALDLFQQALKISEEINDSFGIAAGLGHIGKVYLEQDDHARAMSYFQRHLEIARDIGDKFEQANAWSTIGESYLRRGNLDSAGIALNNSYSLLTDIKDKRAMGAVLNSLAGLERKKGNNTEAMILYRQGIAHTDPSITLNALSDLYVGIASLFHQSGHSDSSIYYALKGLEAARSNAYSKGILAASKLLAEVYEPVDEHEAYKYQKMAIAINDSLFNSAKNTEVQNLLFLDQQRLQSIETAKTDDRNRLRLYLLLAGLGVFLLVAVILYRNNRAKQKANVQLKAQKQEIEVQRSSAEKALDELKTTQAQLIQAEKMASLGELTAGIAHEIQNPLNFVNNFSELNKELLSEMNEELAKGNIEDAQSVSKDIASNEEKILYHGKRADAIVKGMLQHSRSGTGLKELTDINALADEYMNLAYHGMRARNPGNAAERPVNAELKTDFDTSIVNVNVVPQDIGRVLLNLFTNAFYAVNEKNKLAGDDYKPVVSVATKRIKEKMEIIVKDNGMGIPGKMLSKIFQPFFTTKPTGSGTGLGLSLSYDIIKAHGGEIKVESKEGMGTEFVITLPFTS